MTDQTIAALANTTTTEVAEYIPARQYAALIVKKAQAKRLLAGLRAAVVRKLEQGEGTIVRVRIWPKRTAQGPISEGSSLSAVADNPTSVDVTIQKYGDYNQLTGESIYQANADIVAMSLEAMGNGIARKYDQLVYDELEGATPGASKTLAVAGELVANDDFAVKLIQLVNEMRKLDVVPTDVLLGPDQVGALAQIKTQNLQVGAGISLDSDGRVSKFYGLQVHDLFSIANANATTASMVQAIVIDRSRAFAEAYGKDLVFKEDEVIESDLYKHVCWSWFGVAEVDTDGIGHILNP
jgi:hypothetical protein